MNNIAVEYFTELRIFILLTVHFDIFLIKIFIIRFIINK